MKKKQSTVVKPIIKNALPLALLAVAQGAHASSKRSSVSKRVARAATDVKTEQGMSAAGDPFGIFNNKKSERKAKRLKRRLNALESLEQGKLLKSGNTLPSRLSGQLKPKKGQGLATKGGGVLTQFSCAPGATYSGQAIDQYILVSNISHFPGSTFFTSGPQCVGDSNYLSCLTGTTSTFGGYTCYSAYCSTYVSGTTFTNNTCQVTGPGGGGVASHHDFNAIPAQCATLRTACQTPAGDVTPPTPTLSGPAGTQYGPFTATIQFDEDVQNFDVTDLTSSGAALSGFQIVSPSEYTVLMSPLANGTVTLDVNATVCTDLAGNANNAANQLSVEVLVDAPPSVVINEVDADTASTDVLEFVELFDGGAGNTSLDGLVLVFFNGSNAELSYSAFDLDGQSTDANGYFVIGNTAVSGVDVSFPSNGLQNGADGVGLYYAHATDFPINTVATTTNLIDAIVYDTNDGDDIDLLAALGEVVQYNEGENGDQDNHSNSRVPNGSGPFVAQLSTPDFSNDPVDSTPPTPVITGPSSTQNGAFSLSIDFAEDVTGFVLGDITVGNGVASSLQDDGSGRYSVTITPSSDGQVTVDIAADIAQDLAGNNNLIATQFSVNADLSGPIPVITGPTASQTGSFTIGINFGETVNGFELADLVVTNGVASGLIQTVTKGGSNQYTATITPDADGQVTVDIAADIAQDLAGNNSGAASQFSVQADVTDPAPAPSSPDAIGGPVVNPFTVFINFGEVVTGFQLADVVVENGQASDLVDLGNGQYSVLITPLENGRVAVNVAQGAAQDEAGNPSDEMPEFALSYQGFPATPIPVLGPLFSVFLSGLLGLVGLRRFLKR